MLPHDISTWWNSTYDHLAVVVELCNYIDQFTCVREHGLREFELTRQEWEC